MAQLSALTDLAMTEVKLNKCESIDYQRCEWK